MKTASATELLVAAGALLNTNAFYKIIGKMGFLEEAEYCPAPEAAR